MTFRSRLQARYSILSSDTEQQPPETTKTDDTQTGSSHPENWQTTIQSGKTPEEIRQDAILLADILTGWQSQILQAQDCYKELSANSDKYLHLYTPILIKGLSREKLEAIATICQKFSKLATIV